ncbi:Rrf2 family transcriptional regulator [Paenibacillus sp. CGMCC 1.16610]|uniref:Rrf2 family transcriptional regulator n=1 Tax=Paenibacillus anseongense TaxID=2682845 RepID=A0ABW9UK01_9BACL|nr:MULTISPECIES: Rrf2 family transcriptional regulator [Paenibacillus]MBA2941354.1 Rrf2 family transcriptional regulator [Paenibacillus sp. CGMCC 1.16610]MVQ40173.1 Rrf2 family transcriptional regulator [Paenibacillus anseongense]
MQFSKSTGHALHAILHLARAERGQHVGIKELAALLGVSESYLSKIMSKLRQDGIVRAMTGASGGYELAKSANLITFLDVIQVVEGRQKMYECFNLDSQQHQLFFESEEQASRHADHHEGNGCLVKKVMDGAEQQMVHYLQQHTIQGVLDSAATTSTK